MDEGGGGQTFDTTRVTVSRSTSSAPPLEPPPRSDDTSADANPTNDLGAPPGVAPDPAALLPWVDTDDGAHASPVASTDDANIAGTEAPGAEGDVASIIRRFHLPPTTSPFAARQFQITVMWGENLLAEPAFRHENFYASAIMPQCPIADGEQRFTETGRILYQPFRSRFIARFMGWEDDAAQIDPALNSFLPARLRAAAERARAAGNIDALLRVWVKTHPSFQYLGSRVEAMPGDVLLSINRDCPTDEAFINQVASLALTIEPNTKGALPDTRAPDDGANPETPVAAERHHLGAGLKPGPHLAHYGLRGDTAAVFEEGVARIRAAAEPLVSKFVDATGLASAVSVVTAKATQDWVNRWSSFMKAASEYKALHDQGLHLPTVDDLLPQVEEYTTRWCTSRFTSREAPLAAS